MAKVEIVFTQVDVQLLILLIQVLIQKYWLQNVHKLKEEEGTDICDQMWGVKVKSCQENKYSSKVEILEKCQFRLHCGQSFVQTKLI